MHTNKYYSKLNVLRAWAREHLQEAPVGHSDNRIIIFEMPSPQSQISVAPNASWDSFGENDPRVRELFLTKGLHVPHTLHATVFYPRLLRELGEYGRRGLPVTQRGTHNVGSQETKAGEVPLKCQTRAALGICW